MQLATTPPLAAKAAGSLVAQRDRYQRLFGIGPLNIHQSIDHSTYRLWFTFLKWLRETIIDNEQLLKAKWTSCQQTKFVRLKFVNQVQSDSQKTVYAKRKRTLL
jgi:hypothetical protein